jgi:hypothetical protein
MRLAFAVVLVGLGAATYGACTSTPLPSHPTDARADAAPVADVGSPDARSAREASSSGGPCGNTVLGGAMAPASECSPSRSEDDVSALVGRPCGVENSVCEYNTCCGGCFVKCVGGQWVPNGHVSDGGVDVCWSYPPEDAC